MSIALPDPQAILAVFLRRVEALMFQGIGLFRYCLPNLNFIAVGPPRKAG